MRCLSKITDTQGNEFNLMQINDFSVITSTIKGYTSPTTTNIWQAGSHTPPSWMSAQGDLLCKVNTSTVAQLQENKMVDNDYLLFKYGRVIQGSDNFYGIGFYNNKNSAVRLDTFGDGPSIGNQTVDCYLGIVLDDDNQRAYILACTDKYNDPTNNKFRIWALAGKYNGTDLYWETFGEVILNQSAGGAGLYGGYKGGAGSGYIGNSLLSNKKMVGYNVPTSSAESTKTESVNTYDNNFVPDKPKAGNGHARIKFLSSEVFNVDAQNQLKDSVRNVTPTVSSGTNGTYDSSTQSYVFNSGCYLGYNSVITKEQLQALTKIIFESDVKVNSGAVGNNYDTEVLLSNSLSGVAGSDLIITAKICNGSYDQAVNTHLAILNYGNYKWQGNAPEDVSANQGSFHNVKHKFSLSNGTVTKIEVYLDNELFAETSPNVQLTLNDDVYYFCVGACDKTSIKNAKVVFE